MTIEECGRYGLSPYTRGNHLTIIWHITTKRSIPVHTGKPFSGACSVLCCRVYPRTHGETGLLLVLIGVPMGLSPYTRGNPCFKICNIYIIGSIPVHTGKPNGRATRLHRVGVYPRTHGETMSQIKDHVCDWGLSPYTRGNLSGCINTSTSLGSIPVHTGKPTPPKVYSPSN